MLALADQIRLADQVDEGGVQIVRLGQPPVYGVLLMTRGSSTALRIRST